MKLRKGNKAYVALTFPKDDLNTILDEICQAVKHGNRKLAAHFMMEADKNDQMSSFGFNFLHKEVNLPIF